MIQLENRIEPLLTQTQIAERVREMGACIAQDYPGNNLLVVGLLSGAFMFMADLIRALNLDVEIGFMRAASYGSGTESSGEVKILQDLDRSVQDLHVLLVEDIIDTGFTLQKVEGLLRGRRPASLRIATLLDKPERRKVPISADYVGFTIEDQFVVGYGLDLDGKFRNLPYVGIYHP